MKHQFKNKKAFTLIELLIVIAIIGILFIVLISKVDFATDKAKATGVQTDFRSFQVAIESVALENAGLATFGWDTGDTNGDRVRNSYDKGDTNQNGIQDNDEVFVGSKTYGETWTNVYTLTNPADADDKSAIAALEAAINKNLDPKLHITIADDLTITMSNGAQDPWNTEYHGYYITNATTDGKDRGAIVMYSNGANQEFGSEHSIAGGVVTVNVPGNNVYGKDDYGMSVIYTYVNGYGEIKTTTSGFSVNQTTQGNVSNSSGSGGTEETEDPTVTELLEPGLYETGAIALVEAGDIETAKDMIKTSWDDLLTAGVVHVTDGVVYSNFDLNAWANASSDVLDGDLVLPNDGSITSIGDFVYDETSGDITGNMAFASCYKLTGISIPDSVTDINNFAFAGCSSLTSVTIGNGVTSMGDQAFAACRSLTSVIIPNSVTNIGKEAFGWCESLTNITIGNSVTCISEGMFYWCFGLTSIEIPDSVTSIGTVAFSDCCSLTRVVLGEGLTSIGEGAFQNCTNLMSVTIPNSVTSIGMSVFFACESLASVTIGNSVTSIHDQVFVGCRSLTSIVIPDSVTSIGSGVFTYCTNLANITVDDNNANYKSIDGDLYSKDGTTLILYALGKTQTSFVIPDGVTSIDGFAFSDCTNLTSVTISDSVTSIGYDAFRECSNLTSITIPDSVTTIGEWAFYNCSSLRSITFSGSMEQWSSIEKMYGWNSWVPATYVQCTDGQTIL